MIAVAVSANSELMMTMEVLIYPVLAFIFLFLIYGSFGHTSEHTRNVTHSLNINIDKCASEHCVRCNKYKSVIKKTSTRYNNEPALQTELKNCSERISQAIRSLDVDRKYETTDKQQPNILYVDGLSAKPLWTEEDFVSDITILESEIQDITSEFEDIYNYVWPVGWLVNNTPAGEWAVFHLINQGLPDKGNSEKCPKTCEILKRLVGSMSGSGNLFANVSFSVVQSGTHISPHYGPTNVRIRCHLGLKVSDPQSSYITVSGESASWETGKCVLFDDSFLHEVHHTDTDKEPRAVLLIDMWHPELTDPEKDIIGNLFKCLQPPENTPIPAIPIAIASEI